MAEKEHMNLVIIGHVDHGKSTLTGRILLEAGAIDPHLVEKYKKEAEEKGKGTFYFAWIMDGLKEERERGVTIDVAHKKFYTDKYYFTVIDAPGHRDFVKNMITGTSQADAAIITCSAVEGPQAQTKEHVFLATTLGIRQIIVAVNKMDAVKYDKAAYDKTVEAMSKLFKIVGVKPETVPFIPVSAYYGDNVKTLSANTPWYKGKTLFQALDDLKVPEKHTEKPLRLPVQDVYTITGVGTVPVGRVETGILKPNTTVIFEPSNVKGEVKSIEEHHESLPQAVPGDNVGFNVRGVAKNDIKRGDVAGPVDNPPSVAKSFIAQVVVLNHPSVITVGYTPVFHCHTAQVACKFEELMYTVDPHSGAHKADHPDYIKNGDIAFVKIVPTKPLVVEPVKEFPPLGRFAIRDMGQTVAAGVCISVEKA
ncbi:MAG: translation elongation factor EF-1 subunit alpha [Candidatus Methanomethylophilus sp.]|jgi:elongation factor 1-alpha|nr:translation elongation factor EF-1 subunit alpha [Methanomethylophilus sp.]MCI2075283.1 translation elongation factor EF-1 subunit alpha [Methanomethylophilus sp.]MCI2092625.1 translation elongation factor EF-1 subunit alpha [Methanomethylophilus sp.]WII09910.1 translation elongation factor EF-1 subunit alpha [Methanomassiliicoccales archaeon LGM-DZ1]